MCLFCDIAKGGVGAHVIYENKETVAFLDVNPSASGHTLVIPREHYPNVAALPDGLAGPVMLAVRESVKLLARALTTDHFTIGSNMGKLSGQEVDHLHVHIIPRFAGDGGNSVQSVVNNPPKEDLAAIKEKILKANNGN